MTSSYVAQSAAAVEENRKHTRRKIEDVLDQLWLAVDIVGYEGKQSAEFEKGFLECQRLICEAVEAVGGTYPPARKALRADVQFREAAE